jgi:hypothetical protein
MNDLRYREFRAEWSPGSRTLTRFFRLAGMEPMREGAVRLHLTAIDAEGKADPEIDRADVVVSEDTLLRIVDAVEGLGGRPVSPRVPRKAQSLPED